MYNNCFHVKWSGIYLVVYIGESLRLVALHGEDDQSILIETSSCNHQIFSELITTQLRISHGVTANSLYLSIMSKYTCSIVLLNLCTGTIQYVPKKVSLFLKIYQNQKYTINFGTFSIVQILLILGLNTCEFYVNFLTHHCTTSNIYFVDLVFFQK